MPTEAAQQFKSLEEFQEWMREDFRTHCEKKYGRELFANYIHSYYTDFMECVEYHIEDLAEQSIQDEELAYDDEEQQHED